MNGLRTRKIILDDNKNQCSSIPNCFVTNKNQFNEYRTKIKTIILNKLNNKFKGKCNLELRWNGERNMTGSKIGDSWTLMNIPQIHCNKIIDELKNLLPNMVIDENDTNSMTVQNANHNTISINFCVELERISIWNSISGILLKSIIIFGFFILLFFIMAIIGSINHYVVPKIIDYNEPCRYISMRPEKINSLCTSFICYPIFGISNTGFNFCTSYICYVVYELAYILNYSCTSFICAILSGISYNPTFINNCQSHFTN